MAEETGVLPGDIDEFRRALIRYLGRLNVTARRGKGARRRTAP